MIDKSMSFLLRELNTFLGTLYQTNEPPAVLSRLASPDGSTPIEIDNKLVVTLINMERDYAARSQQQPMTATGTSTWQTSTPLNLNLYFLLSASFQGNYEVALQMLSSAIGFLQARPVFGPQDSALFPRGLERLTVEMVNLTIGDLHNIWSCNGAKYLPSAFYKMRMVTLQDAWTVDRVPVITGTSAKT
jgi:Pvc16 N-terminal domain